MRKSRCSTPSSIHRWMGEGWGRGSALNTGLKRYLHGRYGGGCCGMLSWRKPPPPSRSLCPPLAKSVIRGFHLEVGTEAGVRGGPPKAFVHLQARGLAPPPESLPREKLSEIPALWRWCSQLQNKNGVGVVCACEPVHLFTHYFWLDTQETDNVAAPGRGLGIWGQRKTSFALFSLDFLKT